MLKILAIGNSFSQDSTTYLYQMSDNSGIELKVVNLYIGGCSLERHWNNVCDNKLDYDYQLNGKSTGRYVGISDTLAEEKWDIVTMQQCSGFSGVLETYYPYIGYLANYIKERLPQAKLMIQQTWAYEIDSNHDQFFFYHKNQLEMYQRLSQCYNTVAQELSIEMIPFGEVIQKLRTISPFQYGNGGMSLCRDGYHMHYIYGRYALAATWFEYVLKSNLLQNNYIPPETEGMVPSGDIIEIMKQYVHKILGGNGEEYFS